MHWKRNIFKNKLKTEERKYRVALEHIGLIVLQTAQIMTVVPCLLLNFTLTITHIKKIIQLDTDEG